MPNMGMGWQWPAVVALGCAAAACASEPTHGGTGAGETNDTNETGRGGAIAPAAKGAKGGIDPRMSAMGRLARLHEARRAHAFRVTSGGCDNEPDCEGDDPGGDDGAIGDDGAAGGNQAEFSLAVDDSGRHVVVGFNDTRGFDKNPVSLSGVMVSDDGGKTFQDLGPLPTPGDQSIGDTKYPNVWGDAEVKYVGACTFVYASILIRKFDDTHTVQTMGVHRSTDCGHTWEGPFEVTAATNPNGKLRADGSPLDSADKELMDVDRATGRVILSWSNFTSTAKGGVEIATTWSDDILAPKPTWSPRAIVSAAEDDGQASIPRFAGRGSKNAYVAWRKFPGQNTNDVGFARSTDGGATWSAPIALSPAPFFTADQVLGNDRINTSPSVAVDRSCGAHAGHVYVVYANNDAKDGADVVFQRSVDEGQTFSKPIVLNGRPGSDRSQWIPWVTVDDLTGRLFVFYYDQGIATSGDLTETTYTFSDDGGETWAAPRPLSTRPWHAAYGNDTGQPNLGDYNQAVALNGDLYAVWAGTSPVGYADGEPTSTSFHVPEMTFRRVRPWEQLPITTVALGDVSFTDAGHDGYVDPGEWIALTIPLRHTATNPLYATPMRAPWTWVETSTPGVSVPFPIGFYRDLAPGETRAAVDPIFVRVDKTFVAGTPIELTVHAASFDGAPVTLHATVRTGTPIATTLLEERFDEVAPGALPTGWTPKHAGGANEVPWTTSSSFCHATSNAAFHVNAEDAPTGNGRKSATRFERLWGPSITVPADSEYVTLDFDVCTDTEDDPAFKVTAYDGLVLRVTDLTEGRQLRSVLVDAFAEEFTTGDLLGYPKHFPRNSDTSYFGDMSAWAGDSGGFRHVHLRLPGMAGSTVQLRFEYTQDSNGTCVDVRPPAPGQTKTCGVAVDNLVMQSVVSRKGPRPRAATTAAIVAR